MNSEVLCWMRVWPYKTIIKIGRDRSLNLSPWHSTVLERASVIPRDCFTVEFPPLRRNCIRLIPIFTCEKGTTSLQKRQKNAALS